MKVTILNVGAIAAALLAIVAIVGILRPYLASEPAPWSSTRTVAQLQQQTIDTFRAFQLGYQQSAASWCEFYRAQYALEAAKVAADQQDANAIGKRDWNAAQRDLWCAQQLATPGQ
jgi:hypothetical protein